jgi:hypothetical protein
MKQEALAMKVALTGATGFIGSHVLTDLYKHGHDVTALVRNDDQADIVAARGATPTVVDLYDRPALQSVFGDADGAIHTASPGDATSADLDSAVVDAAIDAFAGTGKPYLQISGTWIYGANTSITEDSPFHAPALVAWKEPIERRVLGAKEMRGVVVVASLAYGDGGGGIPGLLLGSPRDARGNLIMLGTGQQHWSVLTLPKARRVCPPRLAPATPPTDRTDVVRQIRFDRVRAGSPSSAGPACDRTADEERGALVGHVSLARGSVWAV